MEKDKQFDLIFSKIEDAFKQGSVNLCPKCNNITKVVSNPYYYWKCETCGHEADYMSLPFKRTKDQVHDIFIEFGRQYLRSISLDKIF